MQTWQIVLLCYFGALVVWLIAHAVLLLVSMITKTKLISLLTGITTILAPLLGVATFIGDIALVVWLFQNGQVFWAVLAILLGFGIVSFIGQILSMPFIWITGLFDTWYDSVISK